MGRADHREADRLIATGGDRIRPEKLDPAALGAFIAVQRRFEQIARRDAADGRPDA